MNEDVRTLSQAYAPDSACSKHCICVFHMRRSARLCTLGLLAESFFYISLVWLDKVSDLLLLTKLQ